MSDAEGDKAGIQEDWELLVSFLPANWRDLAAETGALNGLRKNKSAEDLLADRGYSMARGLRHVVQACW